MEVRMSEGLPQDGQNLRSGSLQSLAGESDFVSAGPKVR